MAEKEAGHDPMKDLYFVLGGLLILIVLWFFSGGPERADLRGIFLAPPPPLDSGDAYGPQVGGSATSTEEDTGGWYVSPGNY